MAGSSRRGWAGPQGPHPPPSRQGRAGGTGWGGSSGGASGQRGDTRQAGRPSAAHPVGQGPARGPLGARDALGPAVRSHPRRRATKLFSPPPLPEGTFQTANHPSPRRPKIFVPVPTPWGRAHAPSHGALPTPPLVLQPVVLSMPFPGHGVPMTEGAQPIRGPETPCPTVS